MGCPTGRIFVEYLDVLRLNEMKIILAIFWLIWYTNFRKGKENPKHQKGNDIMLKVVMNGAIDSMSTVSNMDEAIAILFPALNNPDVSGHLANAETGEALVTMENGNVIYIAPDTMIEMLDYIFEKEPMVALGLAVELMGLI